MQQLEKIRSFLTGRLFFTGLDIISLLIFIPILFSYSVQLALIVLMFTLIIGAVIGAMVPTYQRRLNALYTAEGQRQSMLVETIHGIRTVKALAIEPSLRRVWDQRSAEADYIGASLRIGELRIPYRLVVAAAVALLLTVVLTTFFSRTFVGRAIKAVGQDEGALRLMGADPVKIKQLAFGIATSVNALAGAMLIIVSPVDPTMDRIYIGRTFCVVVLAGMGSMSGTLVAGLVLGVAESIVLTMFGASWATAVAFGLLLLMLGIRPQGLFGR
jgi:branched-subunit amino acid ABC-type transport system permease component